MFTSLAMITVAILGWMAQRQQRFDRAENSDVNIMQSRQDLRLIAYLLAAILVTLSVIADRIH
jgi:hypothetical protein